MSFAAWNFVLIIVDDETRYGVQLCMYFWAHVPYALISIHKCTEKIHQNAGDVVFLCVSVSFYVIFLLSYIQCERILHYNYRLIYIMCCIFGMVLFMLGIVEWTFRYPYGILYILTKWSS